MMMLAGALPALLAAGPATAVPAATTAAIPDVPSARQERLFLSDGEQELDAALELDAAFIRARGAPAREAELLEGALEAAVQGGYDGSAPLPEIGDGEKRQWDQQLRKMWQPGDPSQPRRRAQQSSDWDAAVRARLPPPPPSCTDPRASNEGAAGACTYDCAALTAHYFGQQPDSSRCFIFDRQAMSWPSELLEMRSQRLDWRTYLEPNPATDPSSLIFTIGEGPTCTNVTFVTVLLDSGERTTEERCLVAGKYEHNHVLTDPHTVEVVGYNSSGVRTGGVTTFVVGDCVDVIIRVTTTAAPPASVEWEVDE